VGNVNQCGIVDHFDADLFPDNLLPSFHKEKTTINYYPTVTELESPIFFFRENRTTVSRINFMSITIGVINLQFFFC